MPHKNALQEAGKIMSHEIWRNNLREFNVSSESNLWLRAKLVLTKISFGFLSKTKYTLLTNLNQTVTEEIPVGTCVKLTMMWTDVMDFSSGVLHFLRVTTPHILKLR